MPYSAAGNHQPLVERLQRMNKARSMISITFHQKLSYAASRVILLMIFTFMLLILTSCNRPAQLFTPAPSAVIIPSATVEQTITAEPAPGLVVSGTVKDGSGAGVENVQIFRSYSAYLGEVIATTDAKGQFISVFYPIPGDEMVSIWAEKPGLGFEPVSYQWRHYYGYERKECDFLAHQP
jgi:hypothetical protein